MKFFEYLFFLVILKIYEIKFFLGKLLGLGSHTEKINTTTSKSITGD